MQKKLQKTAALAAALASWTEAKGLEPSDLLMYQAGPLVLKPQFGITETFNDNITYRDVQQQADLITVLSPGLALQVGRKDFNFWNLSYSYDREIYADHNELDANQHHLSSHLKIEKRRLVLDGNDSIDLLSSPIGGGYSAGVIGRGGEAVTISNAKIDRGSYFDLWRLTWDATERSDLYVQALHAFADYQDNIALYDSRTISGTAGFEYHPFAKTYFFGETYYGNTQNDPNAPGQPVYPTTDFIGFFVGARGQFTDRLKGMAKAGYEHRWYGMGAGTFDAPVVELSLDQQLFERTLLSAGYSRRQYESVQFVRTPYSTDALTFSWLQQIGADGRLKSVLRGTYLLSNFDSSSVAVSTREDQLLSLGLTISYDIKLWMHAFGSYNFEHLDSTLASIVKYDVNRITLGLQFGY